MKTYSVPKITIDLCQVSDIIALSIIDGGSADPDISVQVKEDNAFAIDWGDVLVDEEND